jgi:hypothetical protein
VLPTLRKDLTAAAALTRPVAIRHAKEGRQSDLRAAAVATYAWQACNTFGGHSFGSKPELCRMPSAPLTLDPSRQEEGRP